MDGLLLLYGIPLLIVGALAWSSRNRVRTAVIHLVLMLAYSAPYMYAATMHPALDGGIGWFFVLALGLAIHSVVALVLVIRLIIQRRQLDRDDR